MEVSPLIQNASPGEWKLAIEAGLSYKSNRLRSEAKKYFVGGPFASAELMDFISTLHNGEIETGNKDQILSNLYSGLADVFPLYLTEARFDELRSTEVWVITQIILKSKVQVENVLNLQNKIKEEFIKYEEYLQQHDTKFLHRIQTDISTEQMKINSSPYIYRMIKRYLANALNKKQGEK